MNTRICNRPTCMIAAKALEYYYKLIQQLSYLYERPLANTFIHTSSEDKHYRPTCIRMFATEAAGGLQTAAPSVSLQ